MKLEVANSFFSTIIRKERTHREDNNTHLKFCSRYMLTLPLSVISQKISGLSRHPTEHHINYYIDDIMLMRKNERGVISMLEVLVRHMCPRG